MKCKVICESLGYNDRVYRNGDYVEVLTSKEVKRLASYGSIEAELSKMVDKSEEGVAAKPLIKSASNIKRKGGITKR